MTTTTIRRILLARGNPLLSQYLQNFPGDLGIDSSLFEPAQVRERLDALDDLDARFGDFQAEEFMGDEGQIPNHARALHARLEAVNTVVYKSIRSEIVRGAPPQTLLLWIQASAPRVETAPGLGYDHRDEVVSGVLQLREPSEPRPHPVPEMVFYQPTPVRHILHLIRASALSKSDVFVDLGSGLGHVALLTSMLTGARSFGIEVEAAYVTSAQECAQSLRLSRVRFIREDARAADLSGGTVFYLYSPFTGSILADVLDRLRKESTSRPIKICALGPCTCTLAKESWLKPIALPDPKQITVFQRRL
jgi:Histone methylation protein DOT1